MIKNYLKVLFIVFCVTLFSKTIHAEIVTVYQSVDPVKIYSLQGTSTTMIFPIEIKIAVVGSNQAFSAEKTETKDTLIVSALKPGVYTNLTVIDREGNKFVFDLFEVSKKTVDKYDLVTVKLKESLPYNTILKIIQNEKYSVEPEIMKLVDMFEVENFEVIDGNVKVELKRCAKINNTDETVYWLRIHNISDKAYVVNTLGLQERKNKFIMTQTEIIKPNDYGDFYLITQGRRLDDNLTLNLTISNEPHEIFLENIPFKSKSFTIYEINQY